MGEPWEMCIAVLMDNKWPRINQAGRRMSLDTRGAEDKLRKCRADVRKQDRKQKQQTADTDQRLGFCPGEQVQDLVQFLSFSTRSHRLQRYQPMILFRCRSIRSFKKNKLDSFISRYSYQYKSKMRLGLVSLYKYKGRGHGEGEKEKNNRAEECPEGTKWINK